MSKLNYEQKMRLKYNQNASRTAYIRLSKAIETYDNNGIYSSIGELLLWVMTTHKWHKTHGLIDYDSRRMSNENGLIISGLSHAYNSMKHNMEIFNIHNKKQGFSFSSFSFSNLDFRPYTVHWIEAGKLLNGKYENQKQNYITYIEGKEVLKTFNEALIFLNKENEKHLFNS